MIILMVGISSNTIYHHDKLIDPTAKAKTERNRDIQITRFVNEIYRSKTTLVLFIFLIIAPLPWMIIPNNVNKKPNMHVVIVGRLLIAFILPQKEGWKYNIPTVNTPLMNGPPYVSSFRPNPIIILK